ncbi:hypothetical protein ZHAS_00007576 [Anopheles sinensis]|uniref:Uncharacterized protein n=1 Tax=Anopheles sinensis TaxID=74873 RepID=A0A084VQF8_ANOSI|nr:hypothetical protein ZHAS_00007576 [Anopheles sinensis]
MRRRYVSTCLTKAQGLAERASVPLGIHICLEMCGSRRAGHIRKEKPVTTAPDSGRRASVPTRSGVTTVGRNGKEMRSMRTRPTNLVRERKKKANLYRRCK